MCVWKVPTQLPLFLSRLNNTSSGSETVWLVSGSFRRILMFFKDDLFDCDYEWDSSVLLLFL